jgi:hypothetical protein
MFPRFFPSVEIRSTRVGRGVFARQRFRRGQIVGDVCGQVFCDHNYGSPFCMELGQGRVLEPLGVFRFLNHSCEPNCELFYQPSDQGDPPDRLWLKALCSIAPGDELTIDYAWPAERAIPCLCGSANCRGWIVAEEEMPLLRHCASEESLPRFQNANCKMQIEK